MMELTVVEVREYTPAYNVLLATAEDLDQARYLTASIDYSDESLLLGAWSDDRCVGFLRLLVQVIGRDVQRPPIQTVNGPLREGYVEAFAVVPDYRRRGIGQQLQERAIALCCARGCYQIRSRSPITSQENYALKLKMGYAVHPSNENDSYYFIKTLDA